MSEATDVTALTLEVAANKEAFGEEPPNRQMLFVIAFLLARGNRSTIQMCSITHFFPKNGISITN